MDFVYICRDGENEELRYSIRSVIKHYPDSRIFLFGGKPSWFNGNHIFVPDLSGKFNNIVSCLKAVSEYEDIEDFILMNDDFFIINKINTFHYYYSGSLQDKLEDHASRYGLSQYARALKTGIKALKGIVETPINYDIHVPMPMNRSKLKEIVDMSACPRSVYGNYHNVGGIEINDVKIYKGDTNIPDSDFLSTEDNSFDIIYNKILKDMFTEKTQYEL